MQYKDLQEIYDFGRKLGLPEIPEQHHAKMFKEWDESGDSKEEIKKQLKEQSETDRGKEIISETVKSKKMLLGLIDIVDKVVSGEIELEDIQLKRLTRFPSGPDREPKQPEEEKFTPPQSTKDLDILLN